MSIWHYPPVLHYPLETFVTLKKEYDLRNLQDHWFIVSWAHSGKAEEFILPARQREEALQTVQARLREVQVNTTGNWGAFELGLGVYRLSSSYRWTGNFWPPDIVNRAEALKLDTIEKIRVVLDNEIRRFDELQRQFEKLAANNHLEEKG